MILDLDEQLEIVDGFKQVLLAVLGSVSADVFDDVAFAVVEFVELAELNGLDGVGLVMVAADLGVFWIRFHS